MTARREILDRPHVREAYERYSSCLDSGDKMPEACVNELEKFLRETDNLLAFDVVMARRLLDEEYRATANYQSTFGVITDLDLKGIAKHNWSDEKFDHAVKLDKWLNGEETAAYTHKYRMLKTTKLWPSGKGGKWQIDEKGVPFYSSHETGYFMPQYIGDELVEKGLATEISAAR
jgi:hypothetical protein